MLQHDGALSRRRVLVEDRKHGHLNPTWQDVSVLESINAAMKPLADFTDVLSVEKYFIVSSASVKQNMCRVLTEKYSSSAS